MVGFKEIGINKDLCKAIDELGFTTPTEVQEQSIPFLLSNNSDLISLAQTGTGKTAAFGLPVIQKTQLKNRFVQSIILCPAFIYTKNKLTYSNMIHDQGGSPFVFDSINEINQDEIALLSTIKFHPIILNFNADYQLEEKSFRNLIYSLSYVFQCWQVDINVNTVWEEISFGISVPSLNI